MPKSAAKRLLEDVNPIEDEMEKMWWFLIETGGGCTAFSKQVGDRVELSITDDAEAPVSMEHDCVFGVFVDGSAVVTFPGVGPVATTNLAVVSRLLTHWIPESRKLLNDSWSYGATGGAGGWRCCRGLILMPSRWLCYLA